MTGWHPHPGPGTPAGPEDLYASTPPWDIGRPQPAFLALARVGAITGRVLDAGCGTGEHTLMAAALAWRQPASTWPPPHCAPPGRKPASGACPRGSGGGTPCGWLSWASHSAPCSTAGCSTSSPTATASPTRAPCARRWSQAAPSSCCASATPSRPATGGGAPGQPGRDHRRVHRRVAGRLDRARHPRHRRQPRRDARLARRRNPDMSTGQDQEGPRC